MAVAERGRVGRCRTKTYVIDPQHTVKAAKSSETTAAKVIQYAFERLAGDPAISLLILVLAVTKSTESTMNATRVTKKAKKLFCAAKKGN